MRSTSFHSNHSQGALLNSIADAGRFLVIEQSLCEVERAMTLTADDSVQNVQTNYEHKVMWTFCKCIVYIFH